MSMSRNNDTLKGPRWRITFEGPYGPVRAHKLIHKGPYGPLWTLMDPYGPFWALSGPYYYDYYLREAPRIWRITFLGDPRFVTLFWDPLMCRPLAK